MEYIDHDHKHTVKRGGSIMSGSSNYDDNIVLDTPEYSKHPLSHTWKGTAKVGTINCPLNLHVLPGDSLRFRPNIFQRFRPLVAPITGELETVQHSFYVPYRMLDFSFEKQLTGGVKGDFKRNLLHFFFNQNPNTVESLKCFGVPLFAAGSLFDQMNLGHSVQVGSTGVMEETPFTSGIKFSCLSLAAYHRIYNDYYRPKEVETDLWCQIETPSSLLAYFQSLLAALNRAGSLTFTQATGFSTTARIEQLWTAMRTEPEFIGFCHFVTWLFTSPDAMPLIASYYGPDYPSGQTNASYNRSNQRLMLKGATQDRIPNANNNGFWMDWCAAVFQIYLLSPEFFPWERDRFTTALPYLMRGQQIALQTALMAANDADGVTTVLSGDSGSSYKLPNFDYLLVGTDSDSNQVELTTGFSIEELRRVNSWTRFLERNARVGYVFDEWLEGFFGIDTKGRDHLARPSYVGGAKFRSDVETVLSTSETESANIGDYRGVATSYGDNSYDFNIAEHGVILGLLACVPRSSYMNVVDRNNAKFGDRTLFFTPDFAHLSEQPVFSGEFDAVYGSAWESWLNDDWNDEDEESVVVGSTCFGYEPRYNEYRSHPSSTHGELKTSLAYFSNARTGYDFAASSYEGQELPNDVFFQHVFPDSEAVGRIFQVSAEMADHFILSVGWDIDSLRLVPRQATPSV